MQRSIRATLIAAGAVALIATPEARAQQPLPRIVSTPQPRAPRPVGRAADAPPHQVPDPRFPQSANDPRFPQSANDPRFDPRYRQPGNPSWDGRRQRRVPPSGGSTVIIVPSGDYGFGYGYGQSAYNSQGGYGYGGVYDVNGRPLSAQLQPSAQMDGFDYTPDMSGSPYAITNEGMMVVDFADRARRAFPSCASQSSIKDPQGRPRTIFYQPTDYWMVLKPGQRGRVQGTPANEEAACYAIDSVGRVVLRY